MRPASALVLIPLVVGFAACGDSGFTEEDVDQARDEGFRQGLRQGNVEGRRDGFRNGRRYVINGFGVKTGKNYIVDFVEGPRGLRIGGELPMPLGVTFTCQTLDECTSSGDPIGIAGAGDDADGDGCHDAYEGDCVPADVPDVDCADVSGPITVVGDDEYGLDGGPNPGDEPPDGIACELG